MNANDKRVRNACYAAYMAEAAVITLPPLLFMTFRELYGISYTLLGTLVLINFCSQLTIDLIFSFFSHKFDISKTVKVTPVLCAAGLAAYAVSPVIFAGSEYIGLAVTTVLFSVAAGLMEVLLSPVVAALPTENPDREMSRLHSLYAWGVVFTVIFATLFLLVFGQDAWQWLAVLLAMIPATSAALYAGTKIPHIDTPEKASGAAAFFKNKGLWLCIAGIFFGSMAENIMSQWASSYLEQALSIPKVWGDVGGVAMFAVMLGLARTLYAKYGKDITRVLMLSACGAAVCYLVAALSSAPLVGLIACAAAGFCTSMLWPGMLMVSGAKFPAGGVLIFAVMAAGGDLGASVGPQMVGLVTDAVIASADGTAFAAQMGLAVEQLGMQLGLLIGMLFPLMAIPVYAKLRKDG